MDRDTRMDVARIGCSIRFVQGYRYLDRCGDALIHLDRVLADGWLPGEVNPQSGSMRNFRLGLAAQFNSQSVGVTQTEYISFEHFLDQSCKLYEVLWNTFEIDKVLSPSLQVILQIGFEELNDASKFALGLNVCADNPAVVGMLGGEKSAIRYTLCTESQFGSGEPAGVRRRRLDFQVLRQERQPDFDERVLMRLPLLPIGQRNALGDLMRLRRKYPSVKPAAVQFDLENSWEGEHLTRTFSLYDFLRESWDWVEHSKQLIEQL